MKNSELEKYFRVLANRRRIEILLLLSDRGPICVNDLASAIKLSFKSTHKHLYQLLYMGFLEKERRGTLVFYNLSDDLNSLHKYLLKPIIKQHI